MNCKLPPFHDGFMTISWLLKEKANADMEMYFMENSFPEFRRLEVSRDDEVFQICYFLFPFRIQAFLESLSFQWFCLSLFR